MAVLYDGSQIDMLEQMRVSLKENMNHDKLQYEFRRKATYYLLSDGRMCEINNMRSVLKLYPGFEKELKRFAKVNNLDFRESRLYSLTMLVKHVDELLAKSLK